MKNQIVREQFNKQAQKFADWAVTRNIRQMQGYCDFCEINSTDTLLDVACGPGALTVYAANRVKHATGVDISDQEIEIAKDLALDFNLLNTQFDCSDVENLPYNDNTFSVVLCKAAFHHFVRPEQVLREMKRCCQPGGKISIQDIVAYDDPYVDQFIERFENLVDICHSKTLHDSEISQLYTYLDINKIEDFKLEVEINLNEYIGHAVQDENCKREIEKLLNGGRKDIRLMDILYHKDGELYFKRNVYSIVGLKK